SGRASGPSGRSKSASAMIAGPSVIKIYSSDAGYFVQFKNDNTVNRSPLGCFDQGLGSNESGEKAWGINLIAPVSSMKLVSRNRMKINVSVAPSTNRMLRRTPRSNVNSVPNP